MNATEIETALTLARAKGYLVIAEPFDPESSDQVQLLNSWNSHCESLGRHRVLVLCTGWGLWRAAIAFHEGPDAEMAYVRHEFEEAFCRHLDSGPRKEDEAWFASTQSRRRAEALAFELAAIDTEPRDSKFEDVFVVHAL
jgi:hypothetical protein